MGARGWCSSGQGRVGEGYGLGLMLVAGMCDFWRSARRAWGHAGKWMGR